MPYCLFLIVFVNFLAAEMTKKFDTASRLWSLYYYPLFMFCFVLLLNFIMIEKRQKAGLSLVDYFSFKKIADLGFIVCSMLLLAGNFLSHHSKGNLAMSIRT